MPLTIRQSSRFKRDVKRLQRQKLDLSQLQTAVEMLVEQQALGEKHRDHFLIGDWKGYRECHIQPDWLLIYRVEGDELQLVRTGSHADLFG